MKKLFSYFMIAAMGIMAACGTPEDEKPDNKPADKNFYGFEVENMGSYVIDEDTFLFQMFTVNEQGQPVRTLSAQVVIPGVSVTNGVAVIPAGTYDLIPGAVNATETHITGSFYQNASSQSSYIMTVATGELEVKHSASGYVFTVYNASGTTVWEDTPREIKGIGIRYTGDVNLSGNVYPQATSGAAVYYGGYQYDETTIQYYWNLQLYLTEELWASFDINLAVDDYEAGIPTGKYAFHYTGEAGTADYSYFHPDYGYAGSLLISGEYIYDLISGGEIDLVNNGDGTYKIDILFYNGTFVPYYINFEGKLPHVDYRKPEGPIEAELNLDGADVTYAGWGMWYVSLTDSSFDDGAGAVLFLELTDGEEVTFEDGITSTTFTIEEGYGEYTIAPGEYYEDENAIYGASVWSFDDMPYDYFTEGTLVVTNNGDGSYKFVVDMTGVQGHFTGTYEGEPNMENLDEEEGGEVVLPEDGFDEGGVVFAKLPAFKAAKDNAVKVIPHKAESYNLPYFGNLAR